MAVSEHVALKNKLVHEFEDLPISNADDEKSELQPEKSDNYSSKKSSLKI